MAFAALPQMTDARAGFRAGNVYEKGLRFSPA